MLDPREALIFAAGAVGGATLLHCYNQRRMGRGPTTCPGGGGGGTTTVPSLQRSSGGGGAAVPTDAEGDYAAAHALVGRCESRCAATCAAQARTRAATMLPGTRPVSAMPLIIRMSLRRLPRHTAPTWLAAWPSV